MRKLKLKELRRVTPEEYSLQPKISVVVVLDNIRSGMNVGSVFRTCDAFSVESIHLCGITACPPHREIHKTAIGATQSVKWHHHSSVMDCVGSMKKQGYRIIGVEQTDQSISMESFAVDPKDRYVLIFGNEVEGLSEELLDVLDHALEIPQFGTKHSLNVSVCAGIVLWHFASSFLA